MFMHGVEKKRLMAVEDQDKKWIGDKNPQK